MVRFSAARAHLVARRAVGGYRARMSTLRETVRLPGLTVEPPSLRGMAAALQALAASTRTRLGVGPRMKAHVDHGAWAGRRAASGDGDRVSSVRGVASSAHGYAEARDDGALASGDLVHDLLEQIEALGGPAPHPAVTIAAGCCESHQTALGCGATWALTVAALLVAAADRVHEDHDVPALAAADAFQEASRIAAETARKLAIPADALPAAFPPGVLSNAIRDALAVVDPRGVGGDEPIPGDEPVPDFPRHLRRGADADAVASLAVGFNRERHPGDARLALAAALLLTRRLPDLDAPRAETVDRADPAVSDLFLEASRATTLAVSGPPASASRVVPGVAFRVTRDHLPGRGREMGGGSVPGDIPGDVSGLRDAIRAWGRKPWRVVFVDGDVAPPPADRRQLRIDASAKSIVDDVRRLLEDRREWYAEEIAEGVRRAGGCDAFVCSGKCDSAVAAALARVAGVRVALCSVGRKSLFAAARLAGVHPTMDPTIVEARDVATGAPGSGTRSLRLETCADAGWDEDAGLDAARRRRDGLAPDESRTVLCATRWREDGDWRDDESESDRDARDDDRIPATSYCPAVTVLACAPVLEVAEARAAEIRRALAKMAHAMDDAGDGVGEHFEFVDGGRRRLRECGWPEGADIEGIEEFEGIEGADARTEDDSDADASRNARRPRGHAVPGAGALELAVAAAISDAARNRAAVAAALQDEYDASAVRGAHEKDPAREYGERHRALAAAREAVCFEAFAEAFRDAHLVAAQNGGARFDDATTRATKAERVLAAWLRVGGKRGERDGVWRAWADARAELEGAELEGAEEGSRRATRLDELRSRRQGIRTAMAITRVTLRSGAVLTRVAQRPTAGR